jgi:hypothetical protein
MAIQVTTLRPGLLVHINTSIKGNVSYLKTEGETIMRDDGSEYTDWETERTIKDPKEQKLATEVRSKARNLVVGVCIPTEHGLLCPVDSREALDTAFDKARDLCAAFNATAKTTRLKFNALAGFIADDDVKAMKAINSEVRGLINEMKTGIENLDVERVRDAAGRTKKIANMMPAQLQQRIDGLVKDVRAQAKRLVEAGEQAATAVDAAVLNKLAGARTAFLDLEDAATVGDGGDTAGRVLDLAPHETTTAAPAPAKAPELEIS